MVSFMTAITLIVIVAGLVPLALAERKTAFEKAHKHSSDSLARDCRVSPIHLRPCVPFLPQTIPAAPTYGVCDAQLEYPGDQCWDQTAWDDLVGRERDVQVSLGQVTYFDFGNPEAPTLILLPGMGSTKTQWDPAFLRDLALHFRLIALDYPGIGTATITDYAEFTVENLTAVVWEFIEELELDHPNLLGFAFSGKVAGLLFLQHGQELGKYVNVAGRIYNASGRTVSDELLQTLTSLDPLEVALAAWPDNACGRANLIAVAEREISHTQEARTAEAMAASRQAQIRWQEEGDTLDLTRLQNSTLIIAGDLDEIAPLEDMSTAAAVLDAERFKVWPGRFHPHFSHYPWASHTVIYQYRPWVVREIIYFLRGRN